MHSWLKNLNSKLYYNHIIQVAITIKFKSKSQDPEFVITAASWKDVLIALCTISELGFLDSWVLKSYYGLVQWMESRLHQRRCWCASCQAATSSFKSRKTLLHHMVQNHSDNARFLVCNQPAINGVICRFETIHSGVLSNHRKHSLAHQRREDWRISCPSVRASFPGSMKWIDISASVSHAPNKIQHYHNNNSIPLTSQCYWCQSLTQISQTGCRILLSTLAAIAATTTHSSCCTAVRMKIEVCHPYSWSPLPMSWTLLLRLHHCSELVSERNRCTYLLTQYYHQ